MEQGGAVELLRSALPELADSTGAAYASLVLNRQGRERRIVCIGTSGEVSGGSSEESADGRFTPALC